ncbi:MAG: hypothetical protein WBO34_07265 [Gammaproteobacteria bacterium]
MAAGRKTGGRKQGTPNARTQAVVERLEAMRCDPITAMARLAQEAEAEGDRALAGRMYGELANYVAPKRKAVEKEVVSEPISFEEAKKECIIFLKNIHDTDRQEILQAAGIGSPQDITESHLRCI